LVAAGGAALGTGAFTTVEAQRTVNIETEGDASAFLALEAADRADDSSQSLGNASSGANQNEYVQETDGTIEINLDGGSDGDEDDAGTGLNQNAVTTFRNLVTITNNGSQTVDSLTLDIQPDSGSVNGGTFSFTIEDSDSRGTISNGSEILGNQSIVSQLTPGTSIDFGLVIDLIDGGNGSGDLPTTNYTLTITAQTADSTNASN
jgi:hypothetical protein